MFWFTSKRRQLPTVPTDDVLPAHFFDDSPMVRDVIIRMMVQFDDVIDPDKISKALETLLSMKGWRRLGGRLRRNSQGKLEIHVPAQYDFTRPAIRSHHVALDMSINEHPLASQLPKPTNTPSVQVGGDVFRELKAREDLPSTLQDYICSDDPPFELHIFTFTDASVVILNFPHFFTDAVGLSKLIENWCKILAGRPHEVDVLSESDPLDVVTSMKAEDSQTESHILRQYTLAGWTLILFALNFAYDIIFGPKMRTRAIFLPAESVSALRKTALASITTGLVDQDTRSKEKSFLTDGDVISAWAIRNISRGLGSRCRRSMAIMNIFELRGRLRQVFSSSAAYVQNAFFVVTTFFNVQEAQMLSLGDIAFHLRHSIQEQTSEPQVKALIRDQRASIQSSDRPVVFGKRDSVLVPFSNWGKARFFDVIDFSPAVVKSATKVGVKRNAPGKPVLFLSCDASSKPNPTHRNVVNVIGKDPLGNYWLTGMLSEAAWTEIETQFQQYIETATW